jgi:hypothetical protein
VAGRQLEKSLQALLGRPVLLLADDQGQLGFAIGAREVDNSTRPNYKKEPLTKLFLF